MNLNEKFSKIFQLLQIQLSKVKKIAMGLIQFGEKTLWGFHQIQFRVLFDEQTNVLQMPSSNAQTKLNDILFIVTILLEVAKRLCVLN